MRDCQDCGHQYYAGDYNGGTVVEGCPKCGSYRTQPNPVESEMTMRDMPAPGENDTGGNPLQEGFMADNGWQNRMKRDESFASVQAAGNPYVAPDELTRYDQEGRPPGQPPGWTPPRYPRGDRDPENSRRPGDVYNPYEKMDQAQLEGIQTAAPGSDSIPPPGVHWQPHGEQPGRGIIDSNGQVHLWPEADEKGLPIYHQDYLNKNGIQGHQLEFSVGTGGQIVPHDFGGRPPYHEGLAPILQQAGLHPPGSQPSVEEDSLWDDDDHLGSTRNKMYLPSWTADTKDIEHDFDVEQIIPPGHHTVEVSVDGEKNPVILQHDNPEALEDAKQRMKSAGVLGTLMGYAGKVALPAAAVALAPETGGLSLAGLSIAGGTMGHLLGNAIQGGGGGGNAAPEQQVTQQPVEALSSIHAALISADLDHPSSNPGFEDTDDPEDVDQHEFNDGEDQGGYDQTSEMGGSQGIPLDGDIGHAFADALPSLLKYYDSPDSGQDDPAIAKLLQLVQVEHPELLEGEHHPDPDDLADLEQIKGQHQANLGVPGVGMAPAGTPQPGAQGMNPMSMVPCSHCGAMGSGSGPCPQCGNLLTPAPNVQQQGVPAPGNPAPQTGPQPAQHVLGANQGPHNPEQFKAVADYLRQSTPPEQLPDVLQDLIDNPDNYGDVLSQIQGKGQPPQPDPDPGPPPPPQMPPGMADPSQMPVDPSQGQGMPMQGKTAIDHRENPLAVPAADQQGQPDPAHDQDSSEFWKTADGAPLQIGAQYEMFTKEYDIPDVVEIIDKKPDFIRYQLTGEYALGHSTELTRQEAEMDGTTFQRADHDHAEDETDTGAPNQGDQPQSAPGPAFASVRQGEAPNSFMYEQTDIPEGRRLKSWGQEGVTGQCANCTRPIVTMPNEPNGDICGPCAYEKLRAPMDEHHDQITAADNVAPKCPACGSHTTETMVSDVDPGHFSCHNCGHTWDRNVVPTTSKVAGAKFTQMEQREFIDEPGEARNKDKLDLSHTHYRQADLSTDDFLWGF